MLQDSTKSQEGGGKVRSGASGRSSVMPACMCDTMDIIRSIAPCRFSRSDTDSLPRNGAPLPVFPLAATKAPRWPREELQLRFKFDAAKCTLSYLPLPFENLSLCPSLSVPPSLSLPLCPTGYCLRRKVRGRLRINEKKVQMNRRYL